MANTFSATTRDSGDDGVGAVTARCQKCGRWMGKRCVQINRSPWICLECFTRALRPIGDGIRKLRGALADPRVIAEAIEAATRRIEETGFSAKWCAEHAVDDHLCNLDHKDEMEIAEMVPDVLRILRGEPTR